MDDFPIQFRVIRGIVVLTVTGELDYSLSELLSQAVDLCLASGRSRIIICSNASYISSAGLGILFGLVEPVREQGGDLRVVFSSKQVFNMFDLLGFPHVFGFAVCRTLDEALDSFGA